MEGGAVAKICHCHNTPFLGIRAISENADENERVEYATFNLKI